VEITEGMLVTPVDPDGLFVEQTDETAGRPDCQLYS